MHADRKNLKISTRVMYDEFRKQGVPVQIIDASSSLLEYKDNLGQTRILFSTSSDKSSAAGAAIARSKIKTAVVARNLSIPTPYSKVCNTYAEAHDFFTANQRVVVKPVGESGGAGVSTNITTSAQLKAAYEYASQFSVNVLVQEHLDGDDIRLLVVAGSFCSAVRRIPAQVAGDGRSTVEELIIKENTSQHRGAGASMQAMDPISMEGAKRYLADEILRVPMKGEVVRVMGPANLSLGGTVEEASGIVSAAMIADAEKITDKLKLDICGVDMIWNREADTYALIEVNSTPGVNMHNDVFWGTSSSAIEKYVQWLVS